MTTRKIEQVSEIAYRALAEHDLETFLSVVHPNVEFGSLIAESEGERFVGREGVRRWWTDLREDLGVEFELLDLEVRSDSIAIPTLMLTAEVRGLRMEQRFWQVVFLQDDLARWWQTYRTYEEAAAAATRLERRETGTAGPSDQGGGMTESEPNQPDRETGAGLEPSEEHDTSQAEGDTSPPDSTENATRPPSNPETDEDKVENAREEFEQAGGGH